MANIETSSRNLAAADSAIAKINAALPTVKDLDASDKEMDELAALAQSTFSDLIDLSLNVEPRFSGPILQSASTLLGHAVTAKMAKMDKKLQMVKLQITAAQLEHKMAMSAPATEDQVIEGEGTVISRNDLLAQILAASKPESKNND